MFFHAGGAYFWSLSDGELVGAEADGDQAESFRGIRRRADDVSIAMEACKDYGVTGQEADNVIKQVRAVVAQWCSEAGKLGIPRSEQELMAPAFVS